jgi:hypothetical protein
MNRADIKLIAAALREAQRRYPDSSPEDLEDEVSDILVDWEVEAAQDRELRGIPEDTSTACNCDDWGTGEGAYHGRI